MASEQAALKKDFFISYTQSDQLWAEWIAWQLEAAGYTTVIQAWDFRPGGNFVIDMQKAATECERTIAVLSADYLNSRFTQPEWAAAFARDPTGAQGLVLPVRVRPCYPEGLLPQIKYIDLVALSRDDARQQLLEQVVRGRAKPKSEPDFQGPAASDTSGPALPEPDAGTKALMRVRESLASCLQPCPTAMKALVKQFEDEVFPEDAAPRSRRLAEALTRLPLDQLVLRFNRAHALLHKGADAAILKSNDEAIVEAVNLTIPIQVDHAHIATARAHFSGGQLSLLRLPTKSATVAEILLAAADGRPTCYHHPPEPKAMPYGKRAQPLSPDTGLASDAATWVNTLRNHLANLLLPVQSRTTYANDPTALDAEINDELQFNIDARTDGFPDRYYVICEPPVIETERSTWGQTMQQLIETYKPLAFVLLGEERPGEQLPESTVSRAIRDILLRSRQLRQMS